jgi:hypothetical protein
VTFLLLIAVPYCAFASAAIVLDDRFAYAPPATMAAFCSFANSFVAHFRAAFSFS